jgi:hypothetical protein
MLVRIIDASEKNLNTLAAAHLMKIGKFEEDFIAECGKLFPDFGEPYLRLTFGEIEMVGEGSDLRVIGRGRSTNEDLTEVFRRYFQHEMFQDCNWRNVINFSGSVYDVALNGLIEYEIERKRLEWGE